MKHLLNKILFLLATCLLPSSLLAQVYNFHNLTVEDGLSQSQILSIFQDKNNNMWFGTNNSGITIYDGKTFKNITTDDGLPDNVIFSIQNSPDGKIWIGTNNGLAIYDGISFKSFSEKELSHPRIFKVFIDKNKKVLLGTGKGVNIYDGNKFKSFSENELLNNSSVFDIIQDSKGNYWFCTTGNGLIKYDGKTFTNFTTKDGLKSDFVYSILEMPDDCIWMFTHKGIYKLKDNKIEEIKIPGTNEFTKTYHGIKDEKGIIWIATSIGVFKYHSNEFKLINSNNGLVNNNIWKIFRDNEGNLWFGSKENGISKFSGEKFLLYNTSQGIENENINFIKINDKHGILLGTDRGLSILKEGSFVNLKPRIANENISVNIKFISDDNNGVIWLGSELFLYKFINSTFSELKSISNKNLNRIYSIYQDNEYLLLGTNEGLATLEKNEIVPYTGIGVSKSFLFAIHKDKSGLLWFGTEDGLYSFDKEKKKLKHYAKSDGFTHKRVRSIIEGNENDLWIGTSEGIFRYQNGTFLKYNTTDGISEDNIYSLAIDKKGTLYVGLPKGFDKIEFQGDKISNIKHYEAKDGFLGQECLPNAIAIDSSGKVYFGTRKGLAIFQPDEEVLNERAPVTRINKINLFGQQTNWKNIADSVDLNGFPVNLKLSYDKNYISFEYIGVSHTNPEKVKYMVMLKGFDKSWLPVSDKMEAVYSNLPPGKYEFMVMACNSDGIWNENPITYKFEIFPPFWETGWFYSIIVLILGGFIFSYFKVQAANRKILHQNEVIEEKNKDLEKANIEIAETNKNITDSINYARRIQDAILPPYSRLQKHLPDSFIIYKPKDIVSGDFYWVHETNNIITIAVVDCTGHGVPGAFMSIIGHNGLSKAINEFNLSDPGLILDKLNELIETTLRQNDSSFVQDGMDIAICCVDLKNKKLSYAGANNSMWIVKKSLSGIENNNPFELLEIRPDKQPIGAFDNKKNFDTKTIQIQKGDTFYLFSDGYADQFGGPNGKKFKSKPFKDLILNTAEKPLKEQGQIIEKAIFDWKGNLEQVDDICVLGFRI